MTDNYLYFYFFDFAIDSFHKQNRNSRIYVASIFGCSVVGVAAWVIHVLLWPYAHQNVQNSMKDLGLNFSCMRLSAQKVITRISLLFGRSNTTNSLCTWNSSVKSTHFGANKLTIAYLTPLASRDCFCFCFIAIQSWVVIVLLHSSQIRFLSFVFVFFAPSKPLSTQASST